jgi:hypothetical protein
MHPTRSLPSVRLRAYSPPRQPPLTNMAGEPLGCHVTPVTGGGWRGRKASSVPRARPLTTGRRECPYDHRALQERIWRWSRPAHKYEQSIETDCASGALFCIMAGLNGIVLRTDLTKPKSLSIFSAALTSADTDRVVSAKTSVAHVRCESTDRALALTDLGTPGTDAMAAEEVSWPSATGVRRSSTGTSTTTHAEGQGRSQVHSTLLMRVLLKPLCCRRCCC